MPGQASSVSFSKVLFRDPAVQRKASLHGGGGRLQVLLKLLLQLLSQFFFGHSVALAEIVADAASVAAIFHISTDIRSDGYLRMNSMLSPAEAFNQSP